MNVKSKTIWRASGVALALLAAPCALAQEGEAPAEAAPAAEENKVDEALQTEIRYVEALIDCGFPDFAEPVIAATKKKWPESEAMFFAIEIRGLLSLQKFDEAQAKIAALPDRKGSKYWAARLEVANNFFARGNKAECSKIYDEFFKTFSDFNKLPKELKEFYRNACYAWGQILVGDKRFDEAVKVYANLLKLINKRGSDEEAATWCNVACETAEMYLHLANGKPDPKSRAPFLDPAKKIVDQLLWEQGQPVYFGRAIAMKANIELLKGDVAKAQGTIDDYMDQLADLHEQLVAADPDGRLGALRLSPMPLCRYMLADMLWKEAQDEAKKPKRDDERVKALLFGEKLKSGKRNGAGAFNHALNVFVKYPESTWAAAAGEMSEAIREFAEKTYNAKIKTNITSEQMAKVRAMQFQSAGAKLAEGDYEGAIADYLDVLARFPEVKESVGALERLVDAHLGLIVRKKGTADQLEAWRMDADAIEGYLAERFAGHKDRAIMTEAGDATLRVAGKEKERGEIARADALYKAFLTNYRAHVNAPTTAAAMAGEAQRAEKWEDALALYEIVDKYYKKSQYYATALIQMSACHEKLGNRAAAIEALKRYCEVETAPLKKTQSQMQLAMLYQKNGLDIFKSAETNETEEAVNKQLAAGSAQIIRGIQQFTDFAKTADEKLNDRSVPAKEKAQYAKLKEGALYLAGDCWGRLTKPAAKLEAFRKRAAAALEEYVKQYPQGQYAKAAYVKLGTLYTALGDVEGSKTALDRLAREFPDAKETKDAKPRLAKSLIEMGMRKEGTEIYAEMLRLDGNYTASQPGVREGHRQGGREPALDRRQGAHRQGEGALQAGPELVCRGAQPDRRLPGGREDVEARHRGGREPAPRRDRLRAGPHREGRQLAQEALRRGGRRGQEAARLLEEQAAGGAGHDRPDERGRGHPPHDRRRRDGAEGAGAGVVRARGLDAPDVPAVARRDGVEPDRQDDGGPAQEPRALLRDDGAALLAAGRRPRQERAEVRPGVPQVLPERQGAHGRAELHQPREVVGRDAGRCRRDAARACCGGGGTRCGGARARGGGGSGRGGGGIITRPVPLTTEQPNQFQGE